jgi:hypothetical protein
MPLTVGNVYIESPEGWELRVQLWRVDWVVKARLRWNCALILQDHGGLNQGGEARTSLSMADLSCVNMGYNLQ